MGKRKVTAGRKGNGNGANLGFEAKLWLAADIAIYGQESKARVQRFA